MSQAADKPVLSVREGELAGYRCVIDKNEFLIGRGGECDLILPERQVSRRHAMIVRRDDGYFIRDLGSKNGTYVNGQQVTDERLLRDGDTIQIALAVKILFTGSEATLPLEFEPSMKTSPGRLRIDSAGRRVFIGDKEITPPLSPPQYRLLELLVANSGRVCTREEVAEAVWPDALSEGVSEQAIDALVRRLRDRLAEVDPDHQYVVTVRGHGFRLDNPPM